MVLRTGQLLAAIVVATSVFGDSRPAFGDKTLAVLGEINALRRQHGLPPVRLEPRLSAEARAHARDMSKYDYLGTRLPNGDAYGTRLVRAGYAYRRMYVRIAAGHPTPLGVVASWAAEEPGRRQLFDAKVADVGLGYAAKLEVSGGSHLDHFWVMTLAEQVTPFNGNWRREVLGLVNGFRSERGLRQLNTDSRLNAAAQTHAEDMAERDYIAHISPDGGTPGERATVIEYRWSRFLENVAVGQPTPTEAVEVCKASHGHRRAMLDPEIRELGIGFAFLPQGDSRVRAGHY
jgi:uncharacterized protein YkwD